MFRVYFHTWKNTCLGCFLKVVLRGWYPPWNTSGPPGETAVPHADWRMSTENNKSLAACQQSLSTRLMMAFDYTKHFRRMIVERLCCIVAKVDKSTNFRTIRFISFKIRRGRGAQETSILRENRKLSIVIKGALDKYNIIPPDHSQTFSKKKVEIFISLEVLAWVMTAGWVLRSRLIYFWRNMNISSIFYFSKSTSINT